MFPSFVFFLLGTFSPRSLLLLSLWKEPCLSCPKVARRRSGRSSAVTCRGHGSGWAPPPACHMNNWHKPVTHSTDDTFKNDSAVLRSNLQPRELQYKQLLRQIFLTSLSRHCVWQMCDWDYFFHKGQKGKKKWALCNVTKGSRQVLALSLSCADVSFNMKSWSKCGWGWKQRAKYVPSSK